MKPKILLAAGCALIAVLAAVMTAGPANAEETSAVAVEVVVKVDDRGKAADRLVARAQHLGGYFLLKSMDAATLRVPAAGLESLLAEVGQTGLVIDRRLRREDLGEALLQKGAALKAKTETQQQYVALLDQADADGALSIEKELVNLVTEIETLKGEIRQMRHRIAMAQVTVRFDYRDRAAPVPDGTSSFAWLNTMNLSDLLKEF